MNWLFDLANLSANGAFPHRRNAAVRRRENLPRKPSCWCWCGEKSAAAFAAATKTGHPH
jgi:hypothetical protein